MTTVQNLEAQPDGTPIKNVLVEVKVYGPTPAAMSTGSNSVVGTATAKSDSAGRWSINLTPNSQIKPTGTCYVFTRTYPPQLAGGTEHGGGRSIQYGIVPPAWAPVNYTDIIVSSPTAEPLSDSELFYHLNDSDPHPQYLTQAEGDARYSGGSNSGDAGPTSATHTFITDWDTALGQKSLSSFGTPTANLPMGGKKLTNVAPGTAGTDAATVSQLNSAMSGQAILLGGGQHLWVQEAAPTAQSTPAPVEGDLWIQKSNALTHTYTSNAWVTAGTTSGRRVVQGTAAGPPTSGAYVVGEVAVSATGRVWTCITAGSPGTWWSAPLVTVASVAPSNAITGDIWIYAS